jgi:hypothetical protein
MSHDELALAGVWFCSRGEPASQVRDTQDAQNEEGLFSWADLRCRWFGRVNTTVIHRQDVVIDLPIDFHKPVVHPYVFPRIGVMGLNRRGNHRIDADDRRGSDPGARFTLRFHVQR